MVLTNNNATALGRHLTVARNRSRATISKRGRKLGSIEISRSLRGLAPFQEAINEVTGRAGFGWLSFFKNLANWIEGDRQPPNDLAKNNAEIFSFSPLERGGFQVLFQPGRLSSLDEGGGGVEKGLIITGFFPRVKLPRCKINRRGLRRRWKLRENATRYPPKETGTQGG